jgi:hypothetical protein
VDSESSSVNQHSDLKKQSQFAGCQMNVTSFQIMDYGAFACLGLGKNKANSKPIQIRRSSLVTRISYRAKGLITSSQSQQWIS